MSPRVRQRCKHHSLCCDGMTRGWNSSSVQMRKLRGVYGHCWFPNSFCKRRAHWKSSCSVHRTGQEHVMDWLIHKLPLPFPRPEGSCSKHKCTSTQEASHTHRLQRPSPQCRHRYANRTTTNEPLPPFQTPESRGFQKSLSSPLRPPTVLPCLWGSPASLWGCVWSPAAGGTMSTLLEGSNG